MNYQYGLGIIFNENPDNLDIAEGVALDGIVDTIHKITVRKNAFFGHGVNLYTGSHDYTKFGEERKGSSAGGPIIINEGAWIGSNAIILGPSEIGENSVIGAGSVIKGKIPAYEVWIGNPARCIKRYNHQKKEWEKVINA